MQCGTLNYARPSNYQMNVAMSQWFTSWALLQSLPQSARPRSITLTMYFVFEYVRLTHKAVNTALLVAGQLSCRQSWVGVAREAPLLRYQSLLPRHQPVAPNPIGSCRLALCASFCTPFGTRLLTEIHTLYGIPILQARTKHPICERFEVGTLHCEPLVLSGAQIWRPRCQHSL